MEVIYHIQVYLVFLAESIAGNRDVWILWLTYNLTLYKNKLMDGCCLGLSQMTETLQVHTNLYDPKRENWNDCFYDYFSSSVKLGISFFHRGYTNLNEVYTCLEIVMFIKQKLLFFVLTLIVWVQNDSFLLPYKHFVTAFSLTYPQTQ